MSRFYWAESNGGSGWTFKQMASGSRSQRRNQRGDVLLFQWSAAASGWRVTKSITDEQFENMRRRGHRFEPIHEWGTNRIVGWQPSNLCGPDQELPSSDTRASITPMEMDLIAGQAFLGGRSKTMGLGEELRINRVHPLTGHALPPEDAVERAVGKLNVFRETRLR